MKKHITIFAIAMFLMAGLNAQTLTVADETATDQYIPVCGSYMSRQQKSQTLYPDTLLTEMTGKYITELTYYFSYAPDAVWGGTQTVRMGVTTANNLENGFVSSPSTLVWTGTLSSNISNDQLHIMLDQPFLYNGENLLIEIVNPTAATYKQTIFSGQNQTSQMSYMALNDVSGTNNGANFLPKLTFTYASTPSCPVPNNLAVSLNGISATFTWSPSPDSVTNYTFGYKSSTDTSYTDIIATDTFLTINNLYRNKTYQWRVRANCGGGEFSYWCDGQSFYIPADTAHLPYHCDFEDSLENHYWRMVNTEDDGWFIGTATAQSGSHSLYVSNDGGISHAVTQATNSNNVKQFWAYRDVYFDPAYTNYQVSLDYKDMSDPWAILTLFIGNPGAAVPTSSSYTPAETISTHYISANDSGWNHLSLLVDSTYQGVKRLYFRFGNPHDPCDPPAAIDNLTIEGNTCPRVHHLQNLTVQDTFALLAWESVGAASYTVAYKSIDDTVFTEVQANDTVLRIGGLNSTTSYVWRVRSHCSDSTESYWSDSITFTTKISIDFLLPYLCDFEDSVENVNWQLSPNNSGYNITFIGNAVACGEGNSLYISNDNGVTNSYTSRMHAPTASREIRLTPGYPKYQISFDCKGGGGMQGFLQVLLDGTPISGYLSEADFWTHHSIVVDSSYAGLHQLSLKFDYNTTWNPAGAFDNISIKGVFHETPVGLSTSDITAHTAQLSWTSDSSETPLSYCLAWRNQFDTNYSEVLLSASDTAYLLDNLQAFSWYAWKVKALCAGNEWSEWSSEKAFQTLTQLPYFCDFEDNTENKNWTIRNGEYSYSSEGTLWLYSDYPNRWFIGAPSDVADNHFLYISKDEGVSNNYWNASSFVWAYRDIYLEPGYPQYQLSLDFKGIGEAGQDYVRLFLDTPEEPSRDRNTAVTFTQIGEDLNLTEHWTHKRFTVDSTHAGAQRLYILWNNNQSTANNPSAAIDNIAINVATCGVPENLVSYPQDTTATLSWSSGSAGIASSYILAYKMLSDSVYTELNTQDTFLTIQGLTPTTDYVWHVKTICSSTDTNEWCGDDFFTTTQLLHHLPYQCDFSDSIENSLWVTLNGDAENRWVIGNATGYNDNNALYISNDSGMTNAYTITATSSVWAYRDIYFDENHFAYQLSFDYKGNGQNIADYMQVFVGVPTIPSGTAIPNGAVQLGGKFSDMNDWVHYSFTLDSTYTGVQRIYFQWVNNNSIGVQPPAAVDNLSVCGLTCSAPLDLTIEDMTTTEATLSWSLGSIGQPSSYTLSLRQAGSTITTEFTTTDTFYVFNSLTPSTTYYCKVRTNCSSNDHSGWSSDLCILMPAVLPYYCDFEDTLERNAWRIVNGNYKNRWYIGNAVSNGGDYSLYISQNEGVSNTYVSVYTSYVWAYRDVYFDPADSGYSLSFDIRTKATMDSYHMAFTDVYLGPPEVPMSDFAPEGATALATGLDGIPNWTTKTYSIDHSHAGLQRLYFLWHNQASPWTFNPPAAIDNISIEGSPCHIPIGLSEHGIMDTLAYLSWSLLDGSADYYTIAYKSETDTVFSYITTQSEQFPLGNLIPSTSYVWKVRAHCNATEFGLWSEERPFQTTENTARIPYLCDFENAYENNGWILLHGTFLGGVATDKWVIGNAVNNGGNSSLYVSKDNGATNSYQIQYEQIWACRDIYFDPIYSDYMISFDCRAQGDNISPGHPGAYAKVFLGLPSTPSTAKVYSEVADVPQGVVQVGDIIYLDSVWHNVSIRLDSTFAGLQRLYILWFNYLSSAKNPAGAFDNIVINGLQCPNTPTNLTVHLIDTMANLSWSIPDGSASQYTVAYKSQNDTAFTYITTQNEQVVLHNLAPMTTYIWKVRAHCSSTDYIFWSEPDTFQTTGHLANLLYLCDFEDTTDNANWTMVNGTCMNQWFIGSAASNGGDYALYVSNDNGVSNTYTMHASDYWSTSASHVWAYRDFFFPPGSSNYQIMFDIRCFGELYYNHPYDFVKVYLGPPAIPQQGVPNGATQIGTEFLNDSLWRTVSFLLDSTFVDTQRLYFYWENDNTYGTNPPGAVDNIMIFCDNISYTCTAPQNLTVTATATDSISIVFSPATDEDQNWQTIIVEADQPLDTTQIIALTDTCYTFNNLQENTAYTIYVRTDCGDSKSDWCSITQWTDSFPVCLPPTDVTATPISHDSVLVDWQPGGSENLWNVVVVLSGDSFDTGTPIVTDSHPIIIGNLLAETSYSVYVQSDCEVNNSVWSSPTTFVTLPNGIDDLENDHHLYIYPNPTSGVITIQHASSHIREIEVSDVFGKLLARIPVNGFQTNLDMSPYDSGVYFVRVSTEQGVVTKRVVKR